MKRIKKQIDLTKFFLNESKSYMKGTSKWDYYTKLPKSYVRFMIFCNQ
jgi:hypothetical protein